MGPYGAQYVPMMVDGVELYFAKTGIKHNQEIFKSIMNGMELEFKQFGAAEGEGHEEFIDI